MVGFRDRVRRFVDGLEIIWGEKFLGIKIKYVIIFIIIIIVFYNE